MSASLGLRLAEAGALPLPLLRVGVRRLLRQRLKELGAGSPEGFLDSLGHGPIAIETKAANEQHYEVPAAFYQCVLGDHLKYSGCYWPEGVSTLSEAEAAALEQVVERAGLRPGQDVLDLGCGWGSFSLFAARRFPDSRFLAVSNSASQKAFIDAHAPNNLEVVTADVNSLELDRRFDRVVSIEMFEHMRNYDALLRRISGWLREEGRLFVHVFAHRDTAYPFEIEGEDNWMGRHFFTGGVMPSVDLFRSFDRDLTVERSWTLDGSHYERTARSWRENLERRRDRAMEILRGTYGEDAGLWYHRWRLFFLACEELFGYRGGSEWVVAHHLFRPRAPMVSPAAP